MVGKKRYILYGIIVILLSSLILINNLYSNTNKEVKIIEYTNDLTKSVYNVATTTTTTTTSTTKKVTATTTTTTKVVQNYTNEVLDEAYSNVTTYNQMINEMIYYINLYRSEVGLPSVTYDYELTVAANVRALEMKKYDYVEHQRPDGTKWYTVLKDLNIKYNLAAENIAYGFKDTLSVSEAFKASSTHYENIINKKITKVGIGIAKKGNVYYFVQLFK